MKSRYLFPLWVSVVCGAVLLSQAAAQPQDKPQPSDDDRPLAKLQLLRQKAAREFVTAVQREYETGIRPVESSYVFLGVEPGKACALSSALAESSQSERCDVNPSGLLFSDVLAPDVLGAIRRHPGRTGRRKLLLVGINVHGMCYRYS